MAFDMAFDLPSNFQSKNQKIRKISFLFFIFVNFLIFKICFLTTFFEKMSFLTFLGLETIGKRSGVVESVG